MDTDFDLSDIVDAVDMDDAPSGCLKIIGYIALAAVSAVGGHLIAKGGLTDLALLPTLASTGIALAAGGLVHFVKSAVARDASALISLAAIVSAGLISGGMLAPDAPQTPPQQQASALKPR